MSNTDRIVDYVLRNAGKLSPEKISALGDLVGSISNEVKTEPNAVKQTEANSEDLLENRPIDLSEVTGFKVDNGPTKKVKIYKT